MLILTVMLAMFSYDDVHACGEIKELKSSVGTISSLGEMKYLVSIPEGTDIVTLEGTTDYTWVEGYAPRSVSTKNGPVEIKVDGAACGFGTYTYFIDFRTIPNTIADNEPPTNDTDTTEPPAIDGTIEEPNYGVLYLSSLKISEIDFEFQPDKRVYDLEIAGNVSILDIEAHTQDSSVVIDISENSKDLKDGLNKITISMSDPYKNTGLYVLNVTKKKAKSPNNFLSSLTIENHQLNFDPSITEYTVEIGKESVLNIAPITESEYAHVTILGNSNLSSGDTVTVRVTAEDGSTKDYIITVKHSFNVMDYWVYIVIVLLIVLLMLILMISKNKKKKGKMGPATIENQANTAGTIQEVTSQNNASVTPIEGTIDSSTLTSSTDGAPSGTLKIIEPTNLETPIVDEAPTEAFAMPTEESSDTEETPTEVFQL